MDLDGESKISEPCVEQLLPIVGEGGLLEQSLVLPTFATVRHRVDILNDKLLNFFHLVCVINLRRKYRDFFGMKRYEKR